MLQCKPSAAVATAAFSSGSVKAGVLRAPLRGPVEDARRCNCGALEEALRMMPGAQRMVVGHTIQEAGINTACGDRVFRIDVGLSQGCGDGAPEVSCHST